MIGNDIIDLAYTKETTNSQRPRFRAKVFNEAEQVFITESKDPFLMVWRLWSMKEAAYKCYLQMGGAAFNSPRRISITLRNKLAGDAQIDDFSVAIITELTKEYIHSYTRLANEQLPVNQVFKLSKDDTKTQSSETHNRLINRIAIDWQIEASELSIKKDRGGKPSLYFHAEKLDIHFSMSHHGKFGAFSFLKPVSQS